MWHLIAHFDGKIYDLGSLVQRSDGNLLIQFYRACVHSENIHFDVQHNPPNRKSQFDFIKDYKTKHFMNAQLETPDVNARFENE